MTVKTAYKRMLHAQTIQFLPTIFCPGQCNIKFTQRLDWCLQTWIEPSTVTHGKTQ